MEKKLPNNWVRTNLEEVANWGSGGTPSRGKETYYGGDIPWIKTGDLNDSIIEEASEYITALGLKNSSAKLFPKGSIGIAMYGATIGKTAVFGIDASTNQACAVAQTYDGVVNTFLHYYLKSEKQNFIEKGKGGAQPNISQTVIKAHPFPLPPLAEQKRIVAKLDQLFGHLENLKTKLEKIPDLLAAFRQSVLTQAVTGKLTEEWRVGRDLESLKDEIEKYIQSNKNLSKNFYSENRFSTSKNPWKNNPNIPNQWVWTIADEIVEEDSDIVYGIVQPGPKLEKGVPYVRGKDIQNGKILVDQLLMTSPEIAIRYERASLKENDILLGIIRNTKVALVPKEINGANITQGTARLRPSRFIIPKFMEIWLLSPLIQNWLHGNYRGIDMPGLNLKDIRKTPFGVPPIEEQTEIVRRVESLFVKADTIEARYNVLKSKIDHLPQAILAKAFRGELVEQLPDDGDARDLLEEIKSAKKSLSSSSKKKKERKEADGQLKLM